MPRYQELAEKPNMYHIQHVSMTFKKELQAPIFKIERKNGPMPHTLTTLMNLYTRSSLWKMQKKTLQF